MSTPFPTATPAKLSGAQGDIAGRIERAKRLGGSGHWVEAAQLYEAILATLLSPSTTPEPADEKAPLVAMVTLALGEVYARQSQFDAGLRMAEMALCYHPTPAQRVCAFVLKGEALCGLGKTAEGIQAFTAAAEQEAVGGRLAAARVMVRLVVSAPIFGRPPEQREQLLQCAETWGDKLISDHTQNPTSQDRAEAWTILGLMAQARGHPAQAIEYSKAALTAAPGYAEATRLLEELSRPVRAIVVPNSLPAKPKPPPCKPLLTSATRMLYARNAFRITALPVDASARDIGRQADRLKIMAELNQPVAGSAAAFAPSPPASLDEIREAMQRLKEPEHRLIDELFWFWPEEYGNSRGDAALLALARGDQQAALEVWREKECDPIAGIVATHNLAVYWHCKALEAENQALAGAGAAASFAEIEAAWSLALAGWTKVAGNDSFWDRVRNRMKNLGAERLTDGFCESMQGWFLQAIDQASGDLALACAAAGHLDDARRQVRRIEQSETRRNEAGKTAELVLAPTKKRLEQQVAFAKSRGQADPEQGPEAAGELFAHVQEAAALVDLFIPPAVAFAPLTLASSWKDQFFKPATDACSELMKLALPRGELRSRGRLDAFVKRVVPEWRKFTESGQPALASPVGKSLVGVLVQIGAEAHNFQKDFPTAAEAFALALDICDDPQQKKTLATDLDNCRRAVQLTLCHFCGRVKGEAGKEKQFWMWGDATRSGNVTNFKHTKVSIPRCPSCKSFHRRGFWWAMVAAFGAGLLAKAILQAMGMPIAFPGWILGGIGGGWLVSRWFLQRHGTKSDTNVKTYFPVADALKRAWKFGSNPNAHLSPKVSRLALFLLAGTAGALVAGLAPLSPPAQWIRYEWAVRHDTRPAYEGFLAAFPAGDYSAAARKRLEAIRAQADWAKVLAAGSDLPTLRSYIAAHPDSDHFAEARHQLEAELMQKWTVLETNGTLEEVRAFRQNNSDFGENQRVLSRFEALLWPAACAEMETNGSCQTLREFVDTCPNSQFASEAKRRLDEMSEKRWAALAGSENADELREFLRVFQGSPNERKASLRLRQVRHGWTADLQTERATIEAAKAALEARQRNLSLQKQNLERQRQTLNSHDVSAVSGFNQAVQQYNQEAQNTRLEQSQLDERIKTFNERIQPNGL